MSKIDDLGIKKFPPKGLFIDHNESQRTAYKKGVIDTLKALMEKINTTNPKDFKTFVDVVFKFIGDYTE